MAQGDTRLTVFFGTEQQRREYIHRKKQDPKRVLLAAGIVHRGGLHGYHGPVEVMLCSDAGVSNQQYFALMEQIDQLNDIYGKKNQ